MFEAPGARVSIRPARGELKLGILAGLKDPGDANLAGLRELVAELRKRGAEVLLADGDLGDNPEAQQSLLGVLTESGLPVLAVAGNREVRADLDAAEAELRRRGAKLWDLSHTRIADLGDALILALPGSFERRQLRAEGACVYVQHDLDVMATMLDKLAAAPAPTVLVAAIPPRGSDAAALDFSEGANGGDPRLWPLLAPKRAAFGIFGQVWEAGARAVDGQGRTVPPGVARDQLYVNPGAADRTPWPMADGSTATGLAALLTVRGRTASYEVVRAPAQSNPQPQGT